jgi:hypothetical protein
MAYRRPPLKMVRFIRFRLPWFRFRLHWFNRLLLAGGVVYAATGKNSFLLLACAFGMCFYAFKVLMWAMRASLFQARRLPKLACALFDTGLMLFWQSEALRSDILIVLLAAATLLLYYIVVNVLHRDVADFILCGAGMTLSISMLEAWIRSPNLERLQAPHPREVWLQRNVFARVSRQMEVLWWGILIVCIYTQFITSQSLGEVSY